MTRSERHPARPGAAAAGAGALADRLLVARRMISGLTVEPEVRMRLHLRLMAICAALKVPGASPSRGASRLDRLVAEAERAATGDTSEPE